jgi:hypothetical protein
VFWDVDAIAAISRRGIRRDFWDLHAIAENRVPLPRAVDAYRRRFQVDRTNLYHVLRSLTYFEDAEKETRMPAGLTARHWDEVKAFFRREAPRLVLDESL